MKNARRFMMADLFAILLVLLLVVTLLFPTLAGVRDATADTTCLNAQKQLAEGLSLYASDHNKYFMPLMKDWNDPVDLSHVTWPRGPILDYVPLRTTGYGCPAHPQETAAVPNAYHFGYSVSTAHPDELQCIRPALQIQLRRTTQVQLPAETMLFADAPVVAQNAPWLVTWDARFWQLPGSVMKTAYHGQDTNIAWADGHAAPIGFVKVTPASGSLNQYYFKFDKTGLSRPQ